MWLIDSQKRLPDASSIVYGPNLSRIPNHVALSLLTTPTFNDSKFQPWATDNQLIALKPLEVPNSTMVRGPVAVTRPGERKSSTKTSMVQWSANGGFHQKSLQQRSRPGNPIWCLEGRFGHAGSHHTTAFHSHLWYPMTRVVAHCPDQSIQQQSFIVL